MPCQHSGLFELRFSLLRVSSVLLVMSPWNPGDGSREGPYSDEHHLLFAYGCCTGTPFATVFVPRILFFRPVYPR